MVRFATIAAAVLWAGALRSQTADQIIARHIVARGGAARLAAVRSEHLEGHVSFGSTASGVDTVDLARPQRIRTIVVLNGKTIVQAYDGHVAWTVNPFAGIDTPQVMAPDLAKNVIAGADMDGPLVNAPAKGNRIALAGLDTADGRPAYKLVVTEPDGLVDTYFIDSATALQTKWQGRRMVDGKPVVFESMFRDYRRVAGVMLAYRIDSYTLGQPGAQHLTFDRIEVNAPEPDDRFTIPR